MQNWYEIKRVDPFNIPTVAFPNPLQPVIVAGLQEAGSPEE